MGTKIHAKFWLRKTMTEAGKANTHVTGGDQNNLLRGLHFYTLKFQ